MAPSDFSFELRPSGSFVIPASSFSSSKSGRTAVVSNPRTLKGLNSIAQGRRASGAPWVNDTDHHGTTLKGSHKALRVRPFQGRRVTIGRCAGCAAVAATLGFGV